MNMEDHPILKPRHKAKHKNRTFIAVIYCTVTVGFSRTSITRTLQVT